MSFLKQPPQPTPEEFGQTLLTFVCTLGLRETMLLDLDVNTALQTIPKGFLSTIDQDQDDSDLVMGAVYKRLEDLSDEQVYVFCQALYDALKRENLNGFLFDVAGFCAGRWCIDIAKRDYKKRDTNAVTACATRLIHLSDDMQDLYFHSFGNIFIP